MKKKTVSKKSSVGGMDKKLLFLVVVMGILVIISGFQMVELRSIKSKIDGGVSVASTGVNTPVASSGASADTLKNNLNSLPKMVGGC